MTTIKINPTVKAEIVANFGNNPMSEIIIKIYEGVYNMACQNGSSLIEGHKMAMQAIASPEMIDMLKNPEKTLAAI